MDNLEVEQIEKVIATLDDTSKDWSTSFEEAKSKLRVLEAKLAEREWQPIETATKDGTEILIACQRENRTYMYVAWYESLDGWWQVTRGSNTVIRNASHWMPLPTPPTQEASK